MKTFEKVVNDFSKIKKFISDDEWQSTILFTLSLSTSFYNDVMSLYRKLEFAKTKKDVNKILEFLRSKSEFYLSKRDIAKNIKQKWNYMRLSYSYYVFAECVIEHSTFSENIITKLKNQYGESYLKQLSNLDKENPTMLTMVAKNKQNCSYSDVEEIYLLLKHWQDLQHIYHETYLKAQYDADSEEFQKFATQKHYFSTPRENLLLMQISKKSVFSIDELAKYILGGMERSLCSLIGGKAFGLAVLRSLLVQVPETYVLPVGAKIGEIKKHLDKNKFYAIRSSANVEDGDNNCFAGIFDSYLNINYEDVEKYCEMVICSKNSPRLNEYTRESKPNIEMALVVQEYIEPQKSGVWLGKSKTGGILQVVDGCAEKLVSGHEEGNIYTSSDIKNKLISEIYHSISKTQLKIGSLADIEWCYRDNKLFYLQYRPVTGKTFVPKNKTKNGGLGVSAGTVVGKVNFMITYDDPFEENSILVCYVAEAEWTDLMLRSKGVVCKVGGFLCHAALICRERNIPCIAGISDEMINKLKDSKEIKINGATGEIDILK